MKPHRRKPTSPRKDGSQPPEEQAPLEPTAMTPPPEEPAQPYVDPGAGDYVDPAQQGYVDPAQQGYVDPNQAYVDPAQQGYVDPNQAYVDPNQQAYVDPNQAYVDPNQAYVDPNQAYVDPGQQAYADPGQAYADPAQQAAVPPPPEISQDAGVYDEAPVQPSQPQQPAPAQRRSRGAQKKVPRRGPQKRPATPRSSSRYTPPKKSYGEGFSLMTVFLSLAILGLIGLIAMVMVPRDLTSISGYPAKLQTEGVPRNLLDEAQRMMINRGKEMAISETELNTYLNLRLQGDQGGMLGSFIEVKGVYVDLAPGTAEIHIERELFGFPLTMSSKVKSENFRGSLVYRPAGWSLGKLESENRTIKPVKELFLRLRTTCTDEYQVLQQMHDVRFEDDKVVLDATI